MKDFYILWRWVNLERTVSRVAKKNALMIYNLKDTEMIIPMLVIIWILGILVE